MAFVEKTEDVCKKNWLLDRGCTYHMCGDIGVFNVLDRCYKSKVKIGNGENVSVEERELF